MAKQTEGQKKTVARVMHEFKHHELDSGSGRKVRNPRQAIAIALSEAGASDRQSPAENRRDRSRTKAKERRGETAQQRKEGGTPRKAAKSRKESGAGRRNASQPRKESRPASRKTAARREPTRAELYREATRRQIAGRSRMTRDELRRALGR